MALPPLQPTSLQRQTTLALVASFVFAVVLVGTGLAFLQLQRTRLDALSSWTARIEALAQSRQRAVEAWVAERSVDSELLARDPSFTGICRSGICPIGQRLQEVQIKLEQWKQLAGFLGAYVFTAGGDLLVMAEQGIPPSDEASQMARTAAREAHLVLHEVERGPGLGPVIGFLSPVFQRAEADETTKTGRVIGVVGLYLDPRDTLFPVVNDGLLFNPGHEVYLVGKRADSVRVLSPVSVPEDSRVGLGFSVERPTSVEWAAVQGREASGLFRDHRGRSVLAATRPIAGTSWALVAKVDEDTFAAEWKRRALSHVRLLAAALLCLTLGGLALWRTWASRRYRMLLEGLRDREERLRALAFGTDDLVFIKDTESRYTLVNPATAELMGVAPEQAIGRRARDFLPETTASVLEAHDREVLQTKAVFKGEERIAADGEDRIFLSSRIPIRNARGEIQGVAGVLRDITLRKRNEEALDAEVRNRRKAEERLRRLHDSTAGFTGADLFRRVAKALAEELSVRWVMVNQVHEEGQAMPLAVWEDCRLIELPAFPLEGTPCKDVVDSASLVYQPNGLGARLLKDSYFHKRRADAYVGAPVTHSKGSVSGVLCALHDQPLEVGETEKDLLYLYARRIAGELERIEAEQDLAKTRRSLETLIQNLPGAVYRCENGRGRSMDFISPGCESITGYPASAFDDGKGLTLEDLIVPDDRERVWREIQTAVSSGDSFEVEYRIHGADESVKWLYDIGRLVRDGEQAEAIEGVLFDQTERRSLEAQLTHSQRMEALGRLAGGVAHDFNNLLTAISGYAEILISRYPNDERGHRPAEEIVLAAERAGDLTRQLLAFSRRQVVEPRVVALDEAVRSVTDMLGRLLGEDIELQTELAPDTGSVRADPGQLEQVLMNLAVNARDAMPGGGRLAVRTYCSHVDNAYALRHEGATPSRCAVIEVTDTGLGMEPDVLEHVFEPFFTTKEEGEGTGLGLATVYGIVRQAGGHITVRSKPGQGTTFRIYWPCCPASTASAVSESEVPRSDGRGEVIVLAEDEATVRHMAAEHLQDKGYTVLEFGSGREVFDALRTIERADVLITDVMMPGMAGPELASRVRERWPHLPVIYVSGHTGRTAMEMGAEGPGTSFLQKPFRLSDLERAIRETLAAKMPHA